MRRCRLYHGARGDGGASFAEGNGQCPQPPAPHLAEVQGRGRPIPFVGCGFDGADPCSPASKHHPLGGAAHGASRAPAAAFDPGGVMHPLPSRGFDLPKRKKVRGPTCHYYRDAGQPRDVRPYLRVPSGWCPLKRAPQQPPVLAARPRASGPLVNPTRYGRSGPAVI